MHLQPPLPTLNALWAASRSGPQTAGEPSCARAAGRDGNRRQTLSLSLGDRVSRKLLARMRPCWQKTPADKVRGVEAARSAPRM
jgi:hypothetical protein